eukprot:scaffold83197_cov45-Phaeocystis_antarctica.AAC.1
MPCACVCVQGMRGCAWRVHEHVHVHVHVHVRMRVHGVCTACAQLLCAWHANGCCMHGTRTSSRGKAAVGCKGVWLGRGKRGALRGAPAACRRSRSGASPRACGSLRG